MGDPRGLQRARRGAASGKYLGDESAVTLLHTVPVGGPATTAGPVCAAGRGTVVSPMPTVCRPHAHSHPKTVVKGMERDRGEKTLSFAPSGDSICTPAFGNDGSRDQHTQVTTQSLGAT